MTFLGGMEVIDLARLSKELPEDHARLKGLIDTTLDLHSSRSDLRIAADLAWQAQRMLRDRPAEPDEGFQDRLLALISTAIIFYARATKTTSDHRRTFDMRPHFDERERERHDRLCNLRDDAVAHYGPGELSETTQLRSDHLVIANSGTLVAISRHTYAAPDFVDELASQGQRALLIMQRLFQEREALLTAELNQQSQNEALEPARVSSIVNLGEAIGDQQMAERILEGPRVGHLRL